MAGRCNALPNSVFGPLFLSRKQVADIQLHQIATYGGMHGIRDEAALDAAVFMPQQSFDGEFLHKDLFEMAAAYAFHISENQPFVDDNKRTGMAASLIFLKLNSVDLVVEQDEHEDLIRSVSTGQATKTDIAGFLSSKFNQST